ncbi:hypothetical protein SA5R_22050 [Pantoea dispersa]|uniref:Uncharacterized protein n=1 Tax=Pantoea dispersa TaxID=59814 RepID=A0A8E1RV03_9GAMM|nr:hypothetical protein SA2_09535 [Pantoea dispersa]KTS20796.1 hypothetical protein SA4R_17680 [Pantoea dispersa]KTS32314.1 hypothetical protein NS389_17950 [Pantoea dispersa]KTS51679.1 hypothetical protein NS380_20175 [Pantoea dispersa]KTS53949.1 hypothetical protein SA5R_22050 [Pantoea dispersa]
MSPDTALSNSGTAQYLPGAFMQRAQIEINLKFLKNIGGFYAFAHFIEDGVRMSYSTRSNSF